MAGSGSGAMGWPQLDRAHAGEGALDHLGRVERRFALLGQVLGLHDAHAVGEQEARQQQGRLRAVDRRRRDHLRGQRQRAGVVDVRVRHEDGVRRLGGQPVEGGPAVLSRARGRAHPRVDEHAPVPDAQEAARGSNLARAAQRDVLHPHVCPLALALALARPVAQARHAGPLSVVSQTRRDEQEPRVPAGCGARPRAAGCCLD